MGERTGCFLRGKLIPFFYNRHPANVLYFSRRFITVHTINIHPSVVRGTIQVPASKSVAQRALAVALIRRGVTILQNTGSSEDELAALAILQQAGCKISQHGSSLTIDSTHEHPDSLRTVSFGESGLSARMFSPLLALQPQELLLIGNGSLLSRSMHFITEVFPHLHVKIASGTDHLPITLQGPLRPASITVDGSVSSQFITGLILAYTAAHAHEVTLKVQNLVSKPYLALTLKVMADMNLPLPEYDAGLEYFRFSNRPISTQPVTYNIEGDWSSAAFLFVAGAIAGEISVTGLDVFSEQGDKTIMQAIMETGAPMSIATEQIKVRKALLKPFHFKAIDHPDLFPPLAVLGAFCNGTSVIEGIHRLVHKESNRAETLQQELGKMGIQITFQDDMMLIKGNQRIHGAVVDARGDHRIAMACAIAALMADGPTTINGAGAVKKSWPGFFTDLQSLGAKINIS